MTRRILVICDPDQNFITAFVNRANRQKTAGFEIRAFTDVKMLLEYIRSGSAELALINESVLTAEISDLCKGRLLILAERRNPKLDFDMDMSPENSSGYIYKYQPVSEMIRQVWIFFSSMKQNSGQNKKSPGGDANASNPEIREADSALLYKPRTEMIGVFSPIGRCGKTSFSLALAQHLQVSKPTLLLSFECLSGWKRTLHIGEGTGGSLADSIYYLRNGNPRIRERILASVQKIGDLSFLPPFDDPVDLVHVTDEEWKVTLESIRDETGFEAVVADLGMVPVVCPFILLNFPRIFMPVGEGAPERAKLDAFDRYLQKNMLDREMKERFIRIKNGENADEAYERANRPDFPGPVPSTDAALVRKREPVG